MGWTEALLVLAGIVAFTALVWWLGELAKHGGRGLRKWLGMKRPDGHGKGT